MRYTGAPRASPFSFWGRGVSVRFPVITLLVLLCAASPVAAQQYVPGGTTPETLKLSAAALAGEQEYIAAVLKLTEQQKSELQVLDRAFIAAMMPIMESYDMGGKLLFCLEAGDQKDSAISAEQPKYVAAFKAYHAEKIAEQENMWRTHRAEAAKVNYISHELMDKHYSYIQLAQKTNAEVMVDRAGRTGVYRNTQCVEVQRKLDASATRKASGNSPVTPPTSPNPPENTPPKPGIGHHEGRLGNPSP